MMVNEKALNMLFSIPIDYSKTHMDLSAFMRVHARTLTELLGPILELTMMYKVKSYWYTNIKYWPFIYQIT